MTNERADINELLASAARHYLSAPAQALRLADEALAAFKTPLDAADAPLHSRALMVRGVALTYGGDFADSVAVLQQALAEAPAHALALRMDVLRALSVSYEHVDALDLALDWAVQSADVARALGEPGRLADALLSIGVVHARNGQTETGLQHALEALQIYTSLDDRRGRLQALNNVGIACKNLGRHDEALTHLRAALEIAGADNDEGSMAIAVSNLAEPLWKLGRIDEALAAARDAAARLQRAGYASGEAHSRTLLGRLLSAHGDPESARAELEAALALANGVGARHHAARAHLALAELHKAARRFEAALQHHEAFHAAERAQFDESSSRKLRALQVHFDLARARHEAQLARLESARLSEQNRTDALTGLANRRGLDQTLGAEDQRAHRFGHPLALALADIDDFKQINDQFGHACGDQVLREVATLLRRHCRSLDLVARYGGEEFCVVFVEAGAAEAARACETIRLAVQRHPWSTLQPELRVTLSFGFAERSASGDTASLLGAADALLYEAKRRGKNRVCGGGQA